MNLLDKVYEQNKKVWFSDAFRKNFELHHVYGRVGVAKCCLHLFHIAERGHQDDYEFVGGLRQVYRNDYLRIQDNYARGMGCKKWLFNSCDDCKMPKLS